MQLQYCSLTGADDETSVNDLSALAAEFPFAEWAVLFYPERAGTRRFPQQEWIKKFSRDCAAQNTAMHLCGDGFLDFVAGRNNIPEVMKGIKRIQLNLKFGNVEGKYDTAELVARVKEAPQFQFILQYTHDNKGLLPLFHDVPNHAVLFDASVGRGILPDRWDAPLDGHFCGYAGGLNPDNVAENIDAIARVAPGYTTWIDMESGVRTDDHFDLAKVRRVLEIAAPFAS